MTFLKNKKLTIILTIALSLGTIGCQNSKAEVLKTATAEKNIENIKENIEETIPQKEYLYSKQLNSPVYDSPETTKKIGTISQNTRVLVLDRKAIEIIDETKVDTQKNNPTNNEPIKKEEEKKVVPFVNDDNESVHISFSDNGDSDIKPTSNANKKENTTQETKKEEKKKYKHWVHIKYRKNLKDREGWILENKLSTSPLANLPKSWNGLQYDNFPEKVEYPDNPKINVKGVYVTAFSLTSKTKLDSLIKLANETEINAFVIDVKDDFGKLLWKMDDSLLEYNPKAFSNVYSKDITPIIKKLKDNNIYLIARIVSFKDPNYARQNPDKAIIERKTGKPFKNKDGIIWVSPHDKNLWKYNIAVAKEAAKMGFNEVQFDYVRFPASNGGKLDKHLDYRNPEKDSKPATIQKYLKYAWEQLSPLHVYINADIYGQIGTFKDDMGLGQYWEALSGYTNYLSPMMYPSHYHTGAYGVVIPDANPYKIIYHTTIDSINRNENIDNPAEIRPWLQDFTAKWIKGHIKYTDKEVREQIKALEDLGIHQYLLWSASNKYHM